MKVFKLKKVQFLNTDIDNAWKFFSDPVNLAFITPPWLNFRLISELPDEIYAGLVIQYKIKPFPGINVNWVTEITHVKSPSYFVDEQRFGPYKFWHHEHHLRNSGNGVEVTDIIHYAVPAGTLLNFLIVSGKLKKIFDYRSEVLEVRFNNKELTL